MVWYLVRGTSSLVRVFGVDSGSAYVCHGHKPARKQSMRFYFRLKKLTLENFNLHVRRVGNRYGT